MALLTPHNRAHRFQLLGWIAVLWLLAGPAHARAPLDVVLLMDSSGSMKQADAGQLRMNLAGELVRALEAQDRVAVVSFSEDAYPLIDLTAPAGRAERWRIARAISDTAARGLFTNIPKALEEASRLLADSARGRHRVIVLMSDGRIDVEQDNGSYALTRHLMLRQVPALVEDGVRIYTTTFTDEANQALLEILADDTGGRFFLLNRRGAVAPVITELLTHARQRRRLGAGETDFKVSRGTGNVLIIARKKTGRDEDYFIESPTGRYFNAGDDTPFLHWYDRGDHMVTVLSHPRAGTWHLGHQGMGKIQILQDLKLRTRIDNEDEAHAGGGVILRAWLDARGSPPVGKTLAQVPIEVDIAFPDGTAAVLALNDKGEFGDKTPGDGIYSSLLTFGQAGNHHLAFNASHRFFALREAVELPVLPPPKSLPAVETPPAAIGGPPVAAASPPRGQTPPQDEAASTAPEPAAAEAGPFKGMDLLWGAAALVSVAMLYLVVRYFRRRKADNSDEVFIEELAAEEETIEAVDPVIQALEDEDDPTGGIPMDDPAFAER